MSLLPPSGDRRTPSCHDMELIEEGFLASLVFGVMFENHPPVP